MTMISSYFAQVGVGIDKSSVASVRTYLGQIEKQIQGFGRRAGKTLSINVKLNIDKSRSIAGLQRSMNMLSKTATMNVRNIKVNPLDVKKAMNVALNTSGAGTRIRMGALLSESSLQAMRNQIRTSINSLVVNPTINPRIRTTAGNRGGIGGSRIMINSDRIRTRSPLGHRQMNPWYNPMMVGGGAGAFMRYGVYSLPFVAGAMGLNSLTNTGAKLQNQQMMLNAASQSRTIGADQMSFLSGVGNRLGKTTASVAPFYAQMYAGSRGTSLEASLPKGFEQFMEYASVMGLGGPQIEGATRALSQMIAKKSIMSEELKI